MRRELLALLVVPLLLLAGWFGYQTLFGEDRSGVLTLVDVQGEVSHERPKERHGARAGDEVRAGERLEAGPDGSAVLTLGEDTRLILKADSSMRVVSVAEDGVKVALDHGRVQATVRPGGAPVGVRAGDGEVLAQDADVTVARGDDGTVGVETTRGTVGLSGFGGVTQARAGERVVAPPGRAARVAASSEALLLSLAPPPSVRTAAPRAAVVGTTEPGARVRVTAAGRTQEVRADVEGRFSVAVDLIEGRNAVVVEATGVLGGETRADWSVERDTEAPPIQIEIH